MLPQKPQFSLKIWLGVTILALLTLLALTIHVTAAYKVQRPITQTGGKINQVYLWGESTTVNGQAVQHRGIDFGYATGTQVFAATDGFVAQIEESWPNNDHSVSNLWGNYVLIRHNKLHYDRVASQWAYVYSLYLHLSQNTVLVNMGDTVTAGQQIAQSDNTGLYTSGAHLHYQVVIHPNSDRLLVTTDSNRLLDSENRSRNPEIWLASFNYNGTNTGTAVGKLTDVNGLPVGGKYIVGLQKPAAAGGTCTATGYGYSFTYNYTWTNPDDIFVENFATTDIAPGTYHLSAYDGFDGSSCTGTGLYRDLGNYTFEAGRTTYIGLYPVYFPDVRGSTTAGAWQSSFTLRNNSSSYTAQIVTTYFYPSGTVANQRTDFLPPNQRLTFSSPGFLTDGSATVVSSQDVAVILENKSTASVTNYNGVSAVDTFGNGTGALLYVPAVKNNFSGRTGTLYIMNVGTSNTTVNITMRAQNNGVSVNCAGFSLAPNQRNTYTPGACGLASNEFYGVKISADQPLAVVSVEQSASGNAYTASSNAFTTGSTTLYAPLIKSAYFGNNTGLAVQNVGGSSADIAVTYYDRDSGSAWSATKTGLAPNSSHAFYVPTIVPAGKVGSAVINATQPVVATVYENKPAQNWYMQYSAVINGSQTAYLPIVIKNLGTNLLRTGVQVQNAGSSNANFRIRYYQTNGVTNTFWDSVAGPIAPNRSATFYTPDNTMLSNGFQGTAVLTSDQPAAVQVNVVSNDTNDAAMIYNGVNR